MRFARKVFPAVALSVATGVAIASVEACREPTQVTLDISYRGGPCGRGIAILTGVDPHTVEDRAESRFYIAQTSACEPNGHVGTLVVTPADGSGRGAVMIIAGITADPSSCLRSNGYEGCIVARRVFTFAEHTSLVLPVALDLACLDVPCNEASSCKNRQCASSDVSCHNDICDDFGVLPDGGTAVEPDAPTSNEASANDGATDGPGNDADVDASLDAGTDGGVDAGKPGCTQISGFCPPYSGAGHPNCLMMGLHCAFGGAPAAPTAMCAPPDPPNKLYDQFCASDRNCQPNNPSCCSMGNAAFCTNVACGSPGSHLCLEDCDCLGPQRCLFTEAGVAPPFVKTCQ